MNEDSYISEQPQRYAQWLRCFTILRTRSIDEEEFVNLCAGVCVDSAASISYLEEQLIQTLNIMLNRCISEFNREIRLYADFGEIENLHIPYARFAKRIRKCFFFTGLDFMSKAFRDELTSNLRQEAERFWKQACRSLYNACLEQHNEQLEDEWYLIRRIRLFPQDKEKYE